MKKKITFKEIAQLANVGVGTVSRYFNNYNISEKAKIKIKNIVDKLGYVPNFSASSLKKGSNDVYVVLPYNLNESANISIAKGIKEILTEHTNFLIYLSSNNPQQYLEDVKELVYRNPKTLIFLLPKEDYQPLIDFIRNIKNVKIFVYNKNLTAQIPTIKLPDFEMFAKLTEQIIKNESDKKITFVGLTKKDKTTGKQRYDGFLAAVKKLNFQNYDWKLIDDNLSELAYEQIAKSYANGSRVIICGTHTIALSAYAYAYKNNLHDLVITDIGYEYMHHFLPKKTYKIFIDYYLIGQIIGLRLFDEAKFKKYKDKTLIYKVISS